MELLHALAVELAAQAAVALDDNGSTLTPAVIEALLPHLRLALEARLA